MKMQNGRKLENKTLTNQVIELHHQGYDCDFLLLGNQLILCMQTNRSYPVSDVTLISIKKAFDDFSNSYKHIHTIETSSGERGVLLTDRVYN